jgi:hypothetical protein
MEITSWNRDICLVTKYFSDVCVNTFPHCFSQTIAKLEQNWSEIAAKSEQNKSENEQQKKITLPGIDENEYYVQLQQ